MSAKFKTLKNVIYLVLGVTIMFLVAYNFYTGRFNFEFAKGKLSGYLSPARDLRGTWISALSGKGLQLSGQFTTEGNTVTNVYEDGDIELIITDVAEGLATGTMRYINICGWGFSTNPLIGKINIPRTCIADTGLMAIKIRVSSSSLDFGTITGEGITATMTGSFTTDFIHGAMTANVAPYGELKGVFNLNRKKE